MSTTGRNDVVRCASDLRPASDDAASPNCLEKQPLSTKSQSDPSSPQPARYAVYVRSRSNIARPQSSADQVDSCKEYAATLNPPLMLVDGGIYSDFGNCPSERPALQALVETAQQQPRPFEHILLTESYHLGREARQIVAITDMFAHYGITVHFVNQGLKSADANFHFLMSFYATCDEQFADALRLKVRRGMQERLMRGFSPGGRVYGYRNNGKRLSIARSEAVTVRRIYSDFASGVSATCIASTLNAEQVPGPGAAKWNWRSVYAVLKRSLYRGKLLWGRTRRMRNPLTGKSEVRRVMESEVLTITDPALRIVDADLVSQVDERLASVFAERIRRVRP